MTVAIILFILVAVGLLARLGKQRVHLPRKVSFEGIEDSQVAQAYDRINRWPQFRLIRRMFADKLAKCYPAGTLADIGCGPGYLVTLIAMKNPDLKVLGLDNSSEMIAAAQDNAARLGLAGRVEYRIGDAGELLLQDEALDFAVSTLSLHHWSKPGEALVEIHRALKPDGQLLLFDLRRDCLGFFLGLLRFATGVVVPVALRRVKEPLGSLLASYTLAEVDKLFGESPFSRYTVQGEVGWFFVHARKAL